MKTITFLPNEQWFVLQLPEANLKKQYAISNHGRVVTFKESIETGTLLKTNSTSKRQPRFSIKIDNKNINKVVCTEVGKHFLPKPNEACTHVIHIDGNIENNHVENLKWVTESEYKKNLMNRMFGSNRKLINTTAIKIFPTEEVVTLDLPNLAKKYAVTNFGRFISYIDDIEKDGVLMQLSLHEEGYKIWRYKQNKKACHMLLHRLVATHFLHKASDEHKFVIHKDHNKLNNAASNLLWVTLEEKTEHLKNCETIVKNNIRNATAEQLAKRGYKLTESKVRIIKKILFDRKRTTRLKMIAKQFGITPMQLRRIQTGENWGWVEG
ncbi:MAG: HNH endonuclease [Chitinophagaceae bacterium]